MKHIFIINPCAGAADSTQEITEKLEPFKDSVDYEIYITRHAGDATTFVDSYCTNHPEEEVRFYACGGDGTINEVASGLVGHPSAQMSCYPSGSGDDYVKYYCDNFGVTKADFLNIDRLLNGNAHPVDMMKVESKGGEKEEVRYSINVCNFGFDAMVAHTMNKVRRKPIIGGKCAYTTGIVKAVVTSRFNQCRIVVDGKVVNDRRMLLCTLANGHYVGGAYKCAPLSKNDDGLIDVNIIKTISLARFASLLKSYRQGTHILKKGIDRFLTHVEGKVVELSHRTPFYVCIDGEMLYGTDYRLEQMPHAVNFVVPMAL